MPYLQMLLQPIDRVTHKAAHSGEAQRQLCSWDMLEYKQLTVQVPQ